MDFEFALVSAVLQKTWPAGENAAQSLGSGWMSSFGHVVMKGQWSELEVSKEWRESRCFSPTVPYRTPSGDPDLQKTNPDYSIRAYGQQAYLEQELLLKSLQGLQIHEFEKGFISVLNVTLQLPRTGSPCLMVCYLATIRSYKRSP